MLFKIKLNMFGLVLGLTSIFVLIVFCSKSGKVILELGIMLSYCSIDSSFILANSLVKFFSIIVIIVCVD